MEEQVNTPVPESTAVEQPVNETKTKPKLGDWIRYHRKPLIIIVIILILGALVFWLRSLAIAATVNGTPITRLAVVREAERLSGQQALEGMIRVRLIEEEAAKQNITVSQEEIDEEIARLEKQVPEQQGMSLDEALAAQKLTRGEIIERIVTQKKLEKLIGDKKNVTDEEVEQYIKENNVTLTEGQEEESRANIKELLENNKFSEEAGALVDRLMEEADIKYLVEY